MTTTTRRSHMLESDFQRQVLDLAAHLGWRHMHAERVTVKRTQRDGSQRTYAQTPLSGSLGPGWVDLTLVRDRILFAELKSDRGVLSEEQKTVRDALRDAGAEYYRWSPRDWAEVVEVLTRRAG